MSRGNGIAHQSGGALCAATALFALAFGSECGRSVGPAADHDAAADGGEGPTSDAGLDMTALDAPTTPDTSLDGGLVDVVPADSLSGDSGMALETSATDTGIPCPPPLDAGPVSDWPGFQRMSQDPCCAADVALDAAGAPPQIQWIPCLNGAPGCVEMKAGWATGTTIQFNGASASVDNAGTARFLGIGRTLTPVVLETDIYDLSTLTPQAAWRVDWSSPACILSVLLASSQILIADFDDAGTLVAHGSPGQLSSIAPTYTRIAGDLSQRGYYGGSETTFGLDFAASTELGRAPLDGGGTFVAASAPGQIQFAFASRNDVFAYSVYGTSGWSQLYLLQADGTLVLFRSNPNAHVLGLQSDGPNLYWTETYGSVNHMAPQTDIQVWTAPYTNDPAQLAATARMIVDFQGPLGTRVAGNWLAFSGLYVFSGSGTSASHSGFFIVRASDGAVIEAPTVGTYQYWVPVYVTATELWAVMKLQGGPQGAAFARVQLGPWSGGG